MGMSNRPLEAASNAGIFTPHDGTQHAAKSSESIHAPLANTMRESPLRNEDTSLPKLSLRKKVLRTLKRVSNKLHRVKSQPPTAATESIQTEGIVFRLLSHVPANDFTSENEDENDAVEGEERQSRTGMDLGTNEGMIGEFREAVTHTTAVDMPYDIWNATVLRSKSHPT
ncbi:hypothetical protein P171DRAFT_439621 [Karstenula rhodostoma CBS 690.94]|uniref:Uncharacterized protein n=1 Tax=Karstenula rhodostoma CBS 690.94 TaxID=1392251 RepID=A0A9P4PVL2_9PLEO|nr:hypothetical protein P171DRAFT_439621 [Karstenula rhodostoma CBS 690.94]